MPKYQTLAEYIATFSPDALRCYHDIKSIVMNSEEDVQERLFAGQVAFYVEATLKHTFHSSPVIVMAFFATHVNVFALANVTFKEQLPLYKFTDKGTMQIPYNVPLNKAILQDLFAASLK